MRERENHTEITEGVFIEMMTETKLADLQTEGQKQIEAVKAFHSDHGDMSSWDGKTKADYDELYAVANDVAQKVAAARADLDVIRQAKELGESIGIPAADTEAQGRDPVREKAKALGLQVTSSVEYKSLMAPYASRAITETARIESDPIPVKSLIRTKALLTGASDTAAGALVFNENSGIVEMLGRKPLTIRDLVTVLRTGSDAVDYVEQTTNTNNAAVVAEATSSAAPTADADGGELILATGGGYKPESDIALVRRTAPVKTIANWMPVTKRALADVAQLEDLINVTLAENVAETEEAQILNGSGSGENLTGINNWSGIQTQAFSTNIFDSVRKGITKVRTVGRAIPTAIVVSPATAEIIDLALDGEQRYRYGGPQEMGPRTMWGIPVVESQTQIDGFALVGDFRKAYLWDREQTTVRMTESHSDFFVRNMVAVLAEERLAFAVVRPKAFVNVDVVA